MALSVERKRSNYEKLRARLKTERSSFESQWRDCNDYILPTRAQFTITDRNRGDRRNLKIIDSTASFSARTLSSGMHSGMTSPARPWFRLTTPDPELAEFGPVKAWLYQYRQLILDVFFRSNVYQILPIVYGDAGTFATGAMSVVEDDEDVLRCYDLPIGTYYLANDREAPGARLHPGDEPHGAAARRDVRAHRRQRAAGLDEHLDAGEGLWDKRQLRGVDRRRPGGRAEPRVRPDEAVQPLQAVRVVLLRARLRGRQAARGEGVRRVPASSASAGM
jgi:hypothetical protein